MLLISGAVASASSLRTDRAATEAYISAERGWLSAAISEHHRSEAAANAVINSVLATCPAAMAGARRDGTAAQQNTREAFVMEANLELALAEFRPLRPALTVTIRKERTLRWSRAVINRRIAGPLHQAQLLLALKSPDLCAQARAAAMSSFTKLPSKTAGFLRAAQPAIDSDYPSSPADALKMMRPYMTTTDKHAASRLISLNNQLDNLNSQFGFAVSLRMIRALFGSS